MASSATDLSGAIRFGGLAVAIGVSLAACALPAVAATGHGGGAMADARRRPVTPPVTTPPSTGTDGDISFGGGKPITGQYPQSLTPIGTPGAPLAPQSGWDRFKDVMLTALATMDTPAGEELAEARAVRAAIQERDVRVASRNLPKRVAVAAK